MKPGLFLIGLFLTFVGAAHVWKVVSVFVTVGGNLDFSHEALGMLVGGVLLIIAASLMPSEDEDDEA